MADVDPDMFPDMNRRVEMRGQGETGRRRRFEAMYAEHHARVLGYVLRRTDSPDDAADVLAETFLVAWRRLDDMPSAEVSHLWLYGVARRVLANHHRGKRRRTKLADRVRDELAARLPLVAPPGEGTPFAAAFRSLSDDDREVLALHGWEGLDAGEIARVLGFSRNAARIRLHRARLRLRAAIAAAPPLETASSASVERASSNRAREPSPREQPDQAERLPAGVVDRIVIKGDRS
jgi:DNA-directed RNA polymerase specialized sigma24 family protein